MADNPTVYLLLDANVLAGYYAPQTFSKWAKPAEEPIKVIIDSVRSGCSQHIRLLTPEVCVAEAQTVLSKHANPYWKGPGTKAKNPKAIHGRRYTTITEKMRTDLHGGRLIESIPLQRYHVLAKHLITPIDHRTRLIRADGSPEQKELGGTDQLICGMAIWLHRLFGAERLVLVTADRRMAKVMQKARKTKDAQAAALGLKQTAAERIGFDWLASIYPPALHLPKATDTDLRNLLGSWPLPTRKRKPRKQDRRPTKKEVEELIELYRAMGIGRDRMPYTSHMKRLTKQFNDVTGHTMSEGEVWEVLIGRLKQGQGKIK